MKNSPEQLTETKDKIIQAAEQLFSEKGFDGTSVNEIAEKAGVNKPLIYYYFKSKDGLLNFLIDTLLQQTKAIAISELTQERLQVIQNNQLQSDANLKLVNMSENEIDQFLTTSIRKSLDFYWQKRNLLRVIVMESLKKGGQSQHLFSMVDLIKDKELLSVLEENGTQVQLNKGILVQRFFIGLIPMINFVIYFDDWKKHYDMSDEELKTIFIENYKKSLYPK